MSENQLFVHERKLYSFRSMRIEIYRFCVTLKVRSMYYKDTRRENTKISRNADEADSQLILKNLIQSSCKHVIILVAGQIHSNNLAHIHI